MAKWEVIRGNIELKEHPNADSLQLGKIGSFQVVCQKGVYADGDEVLFIPEKSVLHDTIAEPYRKYLAGPDKNRVKAVRLRGELSMGICMSMQEAWNLCGEIPDDCGDLAEVLGITKYEPPIPHCLAGEVEPISGLWSQHDVEQFGIYASEFGDDEDVMITEKIHGSQVMYGLSSSGDFVVASKGLLSRGLSLKDTESNTYWRAARNCDINRMMEQYAGELDDGWKTIQFFGEVIPVQGGNWTYGHDPNKPTVLLYDVRVDGNSVPFLWLPDEVIDLWVPVIPVGAGGYRLTGKFGGVKSKLPELCKAKERVSGNDLHISEGLVVRPYPDRRASDGTRLMVKVINPAYAKKETGEEIS